MEKGIIRQHNVITEARYDMSALEKNIVYMVLSQLKENDPVNKMYLLSIQELQENLKKIGQEITRNQIIEATGKLMSLIYTIENEAGFILLSLLASVEHFSDVIEIELSTDIRPYLLALKKDYTEFELNMALSLKSKYSKRMYEMLSQHKEAGIFEISVQELKERLEIIHPATKADKYKEWSSFSSAVLETPKRELAEHTDINFTYRIKKTGPKFTDLEFHITPNPLPLKE